MKLLEVVEHVQRLTNGCQYAVIGGLAQMLWARKTHTDDLDIALAAGDFRQAYERVRKGTVGWALPAKPDLPHEQNAIFEVAHLLFRGTVVDLITFANQGLNAAIIDTAVPVARLNGIRFIRPELLLITHLLRPGPRGALAAIELLVARSEHGGLDLAEVESWAARVDKLGALSRVRDHAESLLESS